MQDIKRFMRWIFAATSVLYLLIYLPTFLWSVHRRPYDLLFLDNLLTGTLFSVVPIVCGVACWVIWKGKPSARGWGIAASLMHIVIFLRPIILSFRSPWWHHIGALAIGIIGLVSSQGAMSNRIPTNPSEPRDSGSGGTRPWGVGFGRNTPTVVTSPYHSLTGF